MAKYLVIDIPHFANWLLNVQRMKIANGVEVDHDVLHFFSPPNHIAYTYKSMWAYGNHFQIDENEGHMAHVTYDSGVIHIQPRQSMFCPRLEHYSGQHALCMGVERDYCVIWRITPCGHEVFMDSCKPPW
jgi:hypothetical protein